MKVVFLKKERVLLVTWTAYYRNCKYEVVEARHSDTITADPENYFSRAEVVAQARDYFEMCKGSTTDNFTML